MTDDPRNREDSARHQHGRAAVPAQESAEPAEVAAESAEGSVPPPVRVRRRWFQCSLRTMLLGTALIACGLGLFVSKVDRARRAVAAIEAIGGTCEYRNRDTEPGQMEAWLRRYLPRSYFDEVIIVQAKCGNKMTDAVAAHFSALTSLEWLDLNGTQVTGAGLEHLSELTSLRDLHLSGTQVTDAGLEHLPGLASLSEIDLSGTQVTIEAVMALRKRLPTLYRTPQ